MNNKNLKLLEEFSSWANKGGMGIHTCDRGRWYKFVISTFRDDDIVSNDNLRELLNNQGWRDFEEKVYKLSNMYEEAIMVLQAYERI